MQADGGEERGGQVRPEEVEEEGQRRGQVEDEAVVLVGGDFGGDAADDGGAAGRVRDGGLGVVGRLEVGGVRGGGAGRGCGAVEERGRPEQGGQAGRWRERGGRAVVEGREEWERWRGRKRLGRA